MEDETATQVGERMMKLSIENYRRDVRFRALVDSAVHQAMEKHRPIDPRDADEVAFTIAREAVVMALTTAFEEDAELKHTREVLGKVLDANIQAGHLVPVRLMAVDA